MDYLAIWVVPGSLEEASMDDSASLGFLFRHTRTSTPLQDMWQAHFEEG